MSGGEKTKITLASQLIGKPDLLLLDEPTNHLDLSGVEWLEEYLSHYDGACIIVSHDRYFLDRVVTKIVELEDGESTTYHDIIFGICEGKGSPTASAVCGLSGAAEGNQKDERDDQAADGMGASRREREVFPPGSFHAESAGSDGKAQTSCSGSEGSGIRFEAGGPLRSKGDSFRECNKRYGDKVLLQQAERLAGVWRESNARRA